MTIAIRCPACGQSRVADDASVGQVVQCNQCGRSFTAIMSNDGTIAPMPGAQSAGPSMQLNQEANPSAEPLPPQTIGRYTVLRKLGAGAMGVVWLAHDPNLDRDVAIKVLAVQTRDADFLKRFLREARLAAKLHHPNTVTVHDVGAEGDRAYMVMELVEGGSLEKATAPDHPMDWREATRAIRDAALGMAAAHELGLVHRDIKPENLMRTTKGVTKVVDFGLARSEFAETRYTQQGTLMGTPAFMAPELWLGQEASPQSDLYALVLTYYFLLTGEIPFYAEQAVQVGHQHLHAPLPDPRTLVAGLPDAVCRILLRGAAKDPADRYANAAELAAELDAVLMAPQRSLSVGTAWEKLGGTADARLVRPPTRKRPAGAWSAGRSRLRRRLLTLLAVGLAAACVLAVVLYAAKDRGLVKGLVTIEPLEPIPASGPAVAEKPVDKASKPALPKEVDTTSKPTLPKEVDTASKPALPKEVDTTSKPAIPKETVKPADVPSTDGGKAAKASEDGARPAARMAEMDGPVSSLLAHRYAAARDQYTEAIAAGRNEAISYAQRAWACLLLEDYAAALSDCDKALVLAPSMATVHTVRGWVLEKIHDRDRARGEYQLAVDRLAGVTEPWRLYFRAAAYAGLGDAGDAQAYERAVADLSRAIQDLENQPWFYAARALVYRSQRRYERALADLQKAISLDPEHGLSYVLLGNTLARMGHALDAEKAYAQALDRLGTDTEDNRALRARGEALRALGSRDPERYGQALAAYDRAVRNQPEDVDALLGRGQVLAAQRSWAGAIAAYDLALQVDPQNDQAWALRGTALLGQHDYPKAIEDFGKAIKLRPWIWSYYRDRGRVWSDLKETTKVRTDLEESLRLLAPQGAADYVHRAWIFYVLGENAKEPEFYDRAIADCTKAVELDPQDANAYNDRGYTYHLQKDYDRALADYAKAIELDPEYAFAYYRRGITHSSKREYDAAIADYTKAIELDPKYALAYYRRGIAHSSKREYDAAIADYTKAVELDPKYALAYNNRGSLYSLKKEYDQAIADYTKAIELDPKYVSAYNNRGNAYHWQKEYDQAIADYTKAIELDPRYATAYNNRGSDYIAMKEYANARVDFEKVLAIDPNNAIAKARLRQLDSLSHKQGPTSGRQPQSNFGLGKPNEPTKPSGAAPIIPPMPSLRPPPMPPKPPMPSLAPPPTSQ